MISEEGDDTTIAEVKDQIYFFVCGKGEDTQSKTTIKLKEILQFFLGRIISSSFLAHYQIQYNL